MVCRYSTLRSNQPTCYPSKAVSTRSGAQRQDQAPHHANSMLGMGKRYEYGDPEQVNPQCTIQNSPVSKLGSRNHHDNAPRGSVCFRIGVFWPETSCSYA